MTYDMIAKISQVTSLVLFMALFAGVVVYVLWPGNAKKFDEIQRKSLELGPDASKSGGR
jgi:cytochrome c oxidase cbb3-type subunit 4